MGDDLEDDYVQGGDEYLSEGEDDLSFTAGGGDPDVDGEGIVPDAEGGSPAPVAGGKRKAEGESDSDDDGEQAGKGQQPAGRELTEAERKKEKKRRNKEKLKEKKKQRLTTAALAPGAAASTSAAAVLNALRLSQRAALSKLSDLEWEDRSLPAAALFSPTTPPASTSGADLLVSLINALPRLLPQAAPASNGAPHVLILAASGQRCADLVRELRPLLGPLEAAPAAAAAVAGKGKGKKEGEKGGKPAKKAKVEAPTKPKYGEIAKLFAKHFKVSEHVTYLENTPLSMAVGTPHRVAELLSSGALKVPPYVLLDYTFRDSKQRGLLDNTECRDAIWASVVAPAQAGLWEGLAKAEEEAGSVKLGVF